MNTSTADSPVRKERAEGLATLKRGCLGEYRGPRFVGRILAGEGRGRRSLSPSRVSAIALLVGGALVFGSFSFFEVTRTAVVFFEGSVEGLTQGSAVLNRCLLCLCTVWFRCDISDPGARPVIRGVLQGLPRPLREALPSSASKEIEV